MLVVKKGRWLTFFLLFSFIIFLSRLPFGATQQQEQGIRLTAVGCGDVIFLMVDCISCVSDRPIILF